MALQVLLAATLRKYFPDYDHANGLTVPIRAGMTVRDLAEQLKLPVADIKLIMIDGRAANWETVLYGNERVALFPPVGGG
ncbi:MoaD/ThiS family protein [Desulfoferrobacter suflitae]|uniref:MoaD/ThiS family protein n=1 Tax=Desulfoferrobacter suflitae TaxID=2865782 RepID=UPI00216467C9|nr:MoaD/ThiS family protein [Desulfoferrobacter suflitae]MCK8603965.1 MoaD/ThiS family protein [Desulfoferrobacter suflitae]